MNNDIALFKKTFYCHWLSMRKIYPVGFQASDMVCNTTKGGKSLYVWVREEGLANSTLNKLGDRDEKRGCDE